VVEVWFALLSFMLTAFAVFDGWNLGAGALHLAVAKTDAERRQVIAALGPMWSWHEVWLLAAGGTFLFAFPRIMAASFSGFYLALWLVLWSFILRGISIEVGGHIEDRLWRSAWDFIFAVASLQLAVLFGVALGNVIRGVPLDASGRFSMSLFTNFGVRGRVGILDWYTISVALVTTVLLAAHGATYLTLKTRGGVHDRSETWARRSWAAALVVFPFVSLETWFVRPELYRGVVERPVAWLAVAVVVVGMWAIWTGLRRRAEQQTFLGSCAVIAGLLAGAAASVFPVMLHSTLASEHALTAYHGATAPHGLAVALVWCPIALLLAFTYLVVILRSFGGKVDAHSDYH
jgi:cytochrome d ubiquinol oxidase subunit II